MINVQPFHNKLDKLKEYMDFFIDGNIIGTIFFDTSALPTLTVKEILNILYTTRVYISHSSNENKTPIFIKQTFEDWLLNQSCNSTVAA
jgi:hypothetical protein